MLLVIKKRLGRWECLHFEPSLLANKTNVEISQKLFQKITDVESAAQWIKSEGLLPIVEKFAPKVKDTFSIGEVTSSCVTDAGEVGVGKLLESLFYECPDSILTTEQTFQKKRELLKIQCHQHGVCSNKFSKRFSIYRQNVCHMSLQNILWVWENTYIETF